MSLPSKSLFRPAFTLMEMMVAVGILVVLILGVGVIFQSVSKTVSVSQSSMQMLSGVRSMQRQLIEDVEHIDKDGFLVIRCKQQSTASAAVAPYTERRFDQMAFMSYGSFPNKSGSGTQFASTVSAPAAFVWWGQVVFEKGTTASTNYPITTNQGNAIPVAQDPNGFVHYDSPKDADFALGRYAMLLMSDPDTAQVTAFTGDAPNGVAAIDISVSNTGTPASHVTQSRYDVAAMSPQQVMTCLIKKITLAGGRSAALSLEADQYCYRHGVLTSPYDGAGLVDGAVRMNPIALQGVSSISIDWTDGTLYKTNDIDISSGKTLAANDPLLGTTKWYGEYSPSIGQTTTGTTLSQTFIDPGTSALPAGSTATNGKDDYVALFSYDNKDKWPKAIRLRYHVVDYSLADYRSADSQGRLIGGRDFVQVIKLPD